MTDKPHTQQEDWLHTEWIRSSAITGKPMSGDTFDRWLATVEAAAEQRGAAIVVDALKREASDPGWEGIVQPGRSLQELVDHIEHGIRADQEGDDD